MHLFVECSNLVFRCLLIACCALASRAEVNKQSDNATRREFTQRPSELYDIGVKDYLDSNYEDCILNLEEAIIVYNDYIMRHRRCQMECRDQIEFDEPLVKVHVEDLRHYESAIKQTLCLLKCKKREGILELWNYIDDKSVKIFEKRIPYKYLQACYAHKSQFQQAANAAFTYLVVNPNDAAIVETLQHYARQPGVITDDVINHEAKEYVYLYVHGTRAYDLKQWDDVIGNMEASLESFLHEEEGCRAQCEGPFDQPPNDFIPSVANHFTHVLMCTRKCNDQLSTLNGERNDDLLPSHYHYLQYAYFKSGKLKEACRAVASYLLFYPGDKTMMHNMEYYSTLPKFDEDFLRPRPEAVRYIRRLTYETKIMDYVTNVFAVETAKLFTQKEDNRIDKEIYLKPKRFSVDNFTTKEECLKLRKLANHFALPGDGYNTGGGAGSPHTIHENYYGLSFKRAALLFRKNEMDADSLRLLTDITARVKQILERKFGVTKLLHYAYTHLVCRSAKNGISNLTRTDFSHPVHADNCNLQTNGTCPKQWPAFTWRDYTAILYLNEEFNGGELFFAKDYYGQHVEDLIRPECGKLVGFTSGGENLHGVRAITSGTRCALAIWFTYDQSNSEEDRKFLYNILIPNK